MRKGIKAALYFSVSAAILGGFQPAHAQEAEKKEAVKQAGMGEIVVTAQRREQALQDVGIAVSVASGDALRLLGAASSTDIAQFTPGVYVGGSVGGQSQQYTIRGVTQSDWFDAIEAPIAAYVDDVYIPTMQGQSLALFDVKRVEVLKGPQGTLFGRNATGGLVHTVINKPSTNKTEGYLNFGYARFSEETVEGAVNVPLSETVAVRLSGYFNRKDDYLKNIYPNNVAAGSPLTFGASPNNNFSPRGLDAGGRETLGGRAQISFEPTDNLSVRLVAQGVKTDLSATPYKTFAARPVFDGSGRQTDSVFVSSATGTFFGYSPPDVEKEVIGTDYTRPNTTSSSMYSAQINYSFGDVDLTSITAYQHHEKDLSLDSDGSPVSVIGYITEAETDAFSQELRLDGSTEALHWVAGAFYLHNKAYNAKGIIGQTGSAFAAAFGYANTGIDFTQVNRLKSDSYSLFGQVDWNFAPSFTLVVGGRYIREHQNFFYDSFGIVNTNDFVLETSGAVAPGLGYGTFTDKRDQDLWAGKLQLEYRPVDDLLLYAGVNRGVKAGSYNSKDYDGTLAIAPSQIPYGAEVLWNYEGGFKYSAEKFSIAASAFYYDYPSYQTFVFAGLTGVVVNKPMEVYGLDIDGQVRLTDNLTANIGAAYSHGEIENFDIGGGILRTVRPTYAPRTQFVSSLTYDVPAQLFGGNVSLNAQGSYNSAFYTGIRNFTAEKVPGHWLANFSATWKNDDGMHVTAFVHNAFDEKYGVIGFDTASFFGSVIRSYGDPLSAGVTAGFDF